MSKILLLALKGASKNSLQYDKNLYEFKSRDRLWNTPHLGLLTIGAILGEIHNITYIDLNYEPLLDFVYDYVFMSPTTSQATQAYKWASIFKVHKIKVAFGGPHVTVLPHEALIYGDMVFCGESETILREFMQGVEKKIYVDENRPSLAQSKIPLYKLCKKNPYSSIPVQLSRGCPHQCEFCLSSSIYGRQIRRKDLSQAYEELSIVKKYFSGKLVFFTDDNFLSNLDYSLEILKILKHLKLQWYAFTDISVCKRQELLDKLYLSGCRKLLIGFESLSEKNLKEINRSGFKSARITEYENSIHEIQSRKVGVIGSFLLGFLHDDESTFSELYDFIWKTRIYGTNITIATPFPGTRFYEDISRKQVLQKEWELYDGFTLLYDIPGIDRTRFMQLYGELIQKINSRDRLGRVMEYFKNLL